MKRNGRFESRETPSSIDGETNGSRYEHGQYEAACEDTGLSKKTLESARHVASSVESSIRIEDLSWNHHQIIASQKPAQQKKQGS